MERWLRNHPIRDTARVLDLPLFEADRIAKLISTMSKLNKIFWPIGKELGNTFRTEDLEKINELLNIADGDGLNARNYKALKIS
jgi:DNA polymerase-3 subunit alpha